MLPRSPPGSARQSARAGRSPPWCCSLFGVGSAATVHRPSRFCGRARGGVGIGREESASERIGLRRDSVLSVSHGIAAERRFTLNGVGCRPTSETTTTYQTIETCFHRHTTTDRSNTSEDRLSSVFGIPPSLCRVGCLACSFYHSSQQLGIRYAVIRQLRRPATRAIPPARVVRFVWRISASVGQSSVHFHRCPASSGRARSVGRVR